MNLPQVNADLSEMYLGILDAVQNEISEMTTDAWPHDPDRGMHMWEPAVRMVDGTLEAWYGPEGDPVLILEPISIDDLRKA
jgi:hypothetical protein